jgi:anthranilate synthase/aminodeoxychorismate synthase-like glutamine amidotransferase
VIDNYDSFTENLVHALAQLGADVCVARNDAVGVEDVMAAKPRGVVVSPGPLTPAEAGISVALVRACGRASPPVPVLGVCLGAQALGVAYGARVVRARRPVHGRATAVRHGGAGVLAGVPSPFPAARYHSLVVSPHRLPRSLRPTAYSEEGEIMALRHERLPAEGLQFHPESFLTPHGPRMLARFLATCGYSGARRRRVVR